jgi:hypothetical protein
LYRMMIKGATGLAGAGFFVYFTWMIAAHSDGPAGIEIPTDVQRVYVNALSCLGAILGVAAIVEFAMKRQQAAMVQHLADYRESVREDLGVFLREEITVWITRSEAHGRGRLVDELTETFDARLGVALRTAAKQAYQEGDKYGFARGVSARASVARQEVPHVLGSNVLQLAPRGGEE